MSVDYHELLKTAEELEAEAAKQSAQKQQNEVDKSKWLSTTETQDLIAILKQDFEDQLLTLLNRCSEMNETQIKFLLGSMISLKQTINRITT